MSDDLLQAYFKQLKTVKPATKEEVDKLWIKAKKGNKKAVKNKNTGQTLMANILCKPTNPETTKIYEEYK